MKPEPEIRPEMDEQVKPDVGTSPTNSKRRTVKKHISER